MYFKYLEEEKDTEMYRSGGQAGVSQEPYRDRNAALVGHKYYSLTTWIAMSE